MSVAPALYYTHNLNPRVAVAVARYLKAPVELIRYEPMGADQEAFRPLNPNMLAPLLVEEARAPLWETDAIAMRLAAMTGGAFWPAEQREQVMMWVSWSSHHFTRAAEAFVWHRVTAPGYGLTGDEAAVAEATPDFMRYAKVLDDTLADRDWLVGGRVSYADFRVATALPFAAVARLPLEDFAHIARWHSRLAEIEAWREPFAGLGKTAESLVNAAR